MPEMPDDLERELAESMDALQIGEDIHEGEILKARHFISVMQF